MTNAPLRVGHDWTMADRFDLLGPNPRNGIALGAVGVLLAVAFFGDPHWTTRYGAYLTAFTVWMVWFVFTFVQWLSEADF